MTSSAESCEETSITTVLEKTLSITGFDGSISYVKLFRICDVQIENLFFG